MSASKRVKSVLDSVEQRADQFNGALQTTTRVFHDRGVALLADLGSSPAVINWLSADLGPLMKHEFGSLNILDTLVGPVPTASPELQGQFATAWRQDAAIAEAESALTQADRALSDAVEEALQALEKEMEQIATKYEREIPDQ
jgi:signal transduction histidine kinase